MRATISRAELFAFARSLGADPDQVRNIEIEGHGVTVVSYHLDERGYRHVAEGTDEAAIETTVIKVVGEGDSDTVPMRHPDLPGRVIDVRPRGVGQRAMAGWEVVAPEPDLPKTEPPAKDGEPKAPATAGASSFPAPRGRRKAKEE